MSRISANENLIRMVIGFMRGVAHAFYMSQQNITHFALAYPHVSHIFLQYGTPKIQME